MVYKKQEGMNFWTPENQGDAIEGVVIAMPTGEYGIQYDIETSVGLVRTPSHKVLQNRMANAKVGMKVKIVFDGTEPPKIKGYKPTQMYTVYFDE
jgi:hypothetical protein